jgi:hypothetical protein
MAQRATQGAVGIADGLKARPPGDFHARELIVSLSQAVRAGGEIDEVHRNRGGPGSGNNAVPRNRSERPGKKTQGKKTTID